MAKDPAAVARIDLAHPKACYRFIRRDGQWITPDKFDHPLSARRVNGLITTTSAPGRSQNPTAGALWHRPDPAGGSHLRYSTMPARCSVTSPSATGWRPTGTAKAGTLRREGEDQACSPVAAYLPVA